MMREEEMTKVSTGQARRGKRMGGSILRRRVGFGGVGKVELS